MTRPTINNEPLRHIPVDDKGVPTFRDIPLLGRMDRWQSSHEQSRAGRDDDKHKHGEA